MKGKHPFETFAGGATRATGHPAAFIIAFGIVLGWGIAGPFFGFSESWQLFINSTTTVVTFLMVFIIQHAQNKDTTAIQLKLNELIASNESASNRLVDIEDLSEAELQTLKKFYVKLAALAEEESDIHASHSLDEAKSSHDEKLDRSSKAGGAKKAGKRRAKA